MTSAGRRGRLLPADGNRLGRLLVWLDDSAGGGSMRGQAVGTFAMCIGMLLGWLASAMVSGRLEAGWALVGGAVGMGVALVLGAMAHAAGARRFGETWWQHAKRGSELSSYGKTSIRIFDKPRRASRFWP